jgi:ABC-type antimicrobial peptide transport system permease subunit
MSETSFAVKDLLRRKFQTGLIMVSLTCSVASTLFLLLFGERIGFGITSATEGTLTRGLSVVFSQFMLFVGVLIFAVGAVVISFIVFLMMAQRTRDFGLIKAAGCPNGVVFGYFLTELLIVTVVCCFLGVVLGVAVDAAVANWGNFQVYQRPPNLWLVPVVFVAYFIFALVFGTKPIIAAAKLSPIKALSPMQYFGLSTSGKHRALLRSGLTFRIASRSLSRRQSTTVRVVLLLSIVFVLLTVSVAGGIIARDTTRGWLEKAAGKGTILIAQERVGVQYQLLLSKFSGVRESFDFNYSDGTLAISDAVFQQLDALQSIACVDARVILKEHVREVSNFTIDPETLATMPVGDNREGDALIIGVDPEKVTGEWFVNGRFLGVGDAWQAVVGDSLAQTMFSQPLVQSIRVRNQTFNVVGVCFDPVDNGNIVYVPIEKLRNTPGAAEPNIVFVQLAPSANRAAALTEITNAVRSVDSGLVVFELDEMMKQNLMFLGSAWSTIMLLPLFTLASAALCLMAHIMLAVDEQRQEFAVLRATGAKPKAITAILAVQSLVVLLASCAVGISLGVITTLMILVPQPVVTSITILEVAGWLFAALGGMFLLSLYPAVKFARTPLLKIMA